MEKCMLGVISVCFGIADTCWSEVLMAIFSCCRASEVKEHEFFKGIDWQQVYLQKVTVVFDLRTVTHVFLLCYLSCSAGGLQ